MLGLVPAYKKLAEAKLKEKEDKTKKKK